MRSLTASITAERRSISFFPVLDLPDDDDDDDDDDEDDEEKENLAVETKRESESIVVNLPRRRHVAMLVSHTTPISASFPNLSVPVSSPIPIGVVKN